MIGTTLDGKYRIERLLGAGAMGSVFAAVDVRSGGEVAVKVIHANLPAGVPGLVQRFEREARAAGSIGTEHIARCLDAGTDPETQRPYMVLEYLVGEDLHQLVKRLGPLPPDLALRVAAQACLGLSSAHQANIIHRDIKPANIFLAKVEGGARTVKLLDFGVAKILRDPGEADGETVGLTRTGSIVGSPLYMSPEQARSVKDIDHRADLWSLGVVLYHSLAGRTPFQHISGLGDLILAMCSGPPPPVQQFAPWVLPEVAALIDRLLRVLPSERFQTAAAVLDALAPLVPGGTSIDDSMLVALDAQTRARIAPTFFRDFGGSSPGARTTTAEEDVLAKSDTVAVDATRPRARDAVSESNHGGASTQSAVSTSKAPRQASTLAVAVGAVACLAAGAVGAYALTRPVAAPVPVAPAPASSVAAPTTAEAPASSHPAATSAVSAVASAAPSASVASSASVTPPATSSATPAASARAPARPRAPAPSATGAERIDHTAFGDRK